MKIEIKELKAITLCLLDHLENECESIEINEDYYWTIPPTQRYDPYKKPKCDELGQLSTEWKDLQRMKRENSNISYGLVWLGEILRNIGEKKIK